MGELSEGLTAAATGQLVFGVAELSFSSQHEELQTDALGAANMLTQGFDPTVSANAGVAEAAQSAVTTVASHGGSLIDTLQHMADMAANTAANERFVAVAFFVGAMLAAAGAFVTSE